MGSSCASSSCAETQASTESPIKTSTAVLTVSLFVAFIIVVVGIPCIISRTRRSSPRARKCLDGLGRWFYGGAPAVSVTPAVADHDVEKCTQQPAPSFILKTLKVARYTKPVDIEAAEAEDCCAICCCDYQEGEHVVKLSCCHLFHRDCITAWLKVDAVCPLCKTNLLPQRQDSVSSESQASQRAPGEAAAGAAPTAGAMARASAAEQGAVLTAAPLAAVTANPATATCTTTLAAMQA